MSTLTNHLELPPTRQGPLAAHLAAFEAFERRAADGAPPWLRALRTSGISYFAERGLPAADQEAWRFTNPSVLARFPFVPAVPQKNGGLSQAKLSRLGIPGLDTCRLVFLDGYFAPQLSSISPRLAGATIGSLAGAIGRNSVEVESHASQAARHEDNPLVALNTAFLQDGAWIHLPDGVVLDTPVHLLFVATQAGATSQPRNLIVAGKQTRLRLVEEYVSLTESPCLTNAVTEIFAGEDSRIEHVKLQRENATSLHVATIEARQQRGSQVLSHSISLGGRWARHDINVRFEDKDCESVLNGLYLAGQEQLVDHHTLADHISPHCSSHEFYHGILNGKAAGVFNGRIFVRQDAQKTNAKQSNRNLLLSNDATVHSKPQLEIFADDVKCTHGATVGQLDDEALFYLRSRGIGEDLARQMLISAFASGVLNRITIEPARKALEKLLTTWLQTQGGTLPCPADEDSNPAGSATTPPLYV